MMLVFANIFCHEGGQSSLDDILFYTSEEMGFSGSPDTLLSVSKI